MPQTIIQSEVLSALSGIGHGFGTRQGGVSKGIYDSLNCGVGSKDDPDCVTENRTRLATAIGGDPSKLITPYQIHSADVITAEAPWAPGKGPKADAIVTATPGLPIAITTADCVPVLFCDPDAGVVGAAHAGWRGAFSGVLEATLDAMDKLNARRERIVASIGPAISQPAYEVGEEFKDTFVSADPENERFFSQPEGHAKPYFDLTGYVEARLAAAGTGQVENMDVCTYRNPERFFSYRRKCHANEPDYGRQISAIVISG